MRSWTASARRCPRPAASSTSSPASGSRHHQTHNGPSSASVPDRTRQRRTPERPCREGEVCPLDAPETISTTTRSSTVRTLQGPLHLPRAPLDHRPRAAVLARSLRDTPHAPRGRGRRGFAWWGRSSQIGGLTGQPIASKRQAWKVFIRPIPPDDGSGLFDHRNRLSLSPNGRRSLVRRSRATSTTQ